LIRAGLVEWQKKGYIKKIINRWYIFAEVPMNDCILFLIANRIYQPSYISVETALSYYNIIPEAVFTITSVSTLKTKSFETSEGSFAYRKLKPALFFGYQVVRWQGFPIKMATPEKTILDYLYLNSHIDQFEDLQGLRFNQEIVSNLIDQQRLQEFLDIFSSKALEKRTTEFLNYLEAC
jgi:predicted transcriptional regulator of viral defense system